MIRHPILAGSWYVAVRLVNFVSSTYSLNFILSCFYSQIELVTEYDLLVSMSIDGFEPLKLRLPTGLANH